MPTPKTKRSSVKPKPRAPAKGLKAKPKAAPARPKASRPKVKSVKSAAVKSKAKTQRKIQPKVKAKVLRKKASPKVKPISPIKKVAAVAPVVTTPKPILPELPANLVTAVRALDGKKAEDIRVLRLGGLSTIADFYIIATGTSEPHLRALRIELDRALTDTDSKVRGIEAQRDSGWVVVDTVDMLFHLFRPETRAAFRLETLWKDSQDIPLRDILAS